MEPDTEVGVELKQVDIEKPASKTDGKKSSSSDSITMIAKFGKERIVLSCLTPETTIGAVKDMLRSRTGVLPKRQKLIGLTLVRTEGGPTTLTDQVLLSGLKVKKAKGKTNGLGESAVVHEFILMGTPEEHIFIVSFACDES